MDANATRHYQQQAIMTASPAQLVAMLYERAIKALHDATEAIQAGDIERRCTENKKAVEIIAHLAMTLDVERGGQIAENLQHLYRFMLQQLVNVDVRNDPKPARDVIALLEPLRDSWQELAKGQQPSAQALKAQPAASGANQDGPVDPTAKAGNIAISA